MTLDPAPSSGETLQGILLNAPNEERHTPLTEVLELSAVRSGMKPAFVTSDPLYPEEVLDLLSAWAADNGLHPLRARALPSYGGTPEERMGVSLLPAQLEFLDWRETLDVGEPKALWIHSGIDQAAAIDAALRGRSPVAHLLAYPVCCARWHTARYARMEKQQLDSYAARYTLSTGQDYIDRYEEAKTDRELLQERKLAESGMEEKLACQWDASISAFPFIGFLACPSCTRHDPSPASEANDAYRRLASNLGGVIHDELEAIGRHYNRKLDSPCPCGRGKKYRKCCLKQE